MASKLSYRLFREEDLPGLLRLWEEETGWGAPSAEQWRSWYVETPHAPSLIVVAVDEVGAAVGQMIFTPALVMVEGRELHAVRVSAPIVSQKVRTTTIRSVNHPAIMLYWEGSLAVAAAGYELIYALPDPAWLAFCQFFPRFVNAEYPCVAVPLAPTPTDLLAVPAGPFGVEHEELWRAAQAAFQMPCAVARSGPWLEYKNGGHLAVELRESGGALVGYSAVKRQSGLLMDLVARSPADLPRVLNATRNALAGIQPGFTALSAMAIPTLAPTLAELGFVPVDYRFIVSCDAISPRLAPATVAPDRWYILPGD